MGLKETWLNVWASLKPGQRIRATIGFSLLPLALYNFVSAHTRKTCQNTSAATVTMRISRVHAQGDIQRPFVTMDE